MVDDNAWVSGASSLASVSSVGLTSCDTFVTVDGSRSATSAPWLSSTVSSTAMPRAKPTHHVIEDTSAEHPDEGEEDRAEEEHDNDGDDENDKEQEQEQNDADSQEYMLPLWATRCSAPLDYQVFEQVVSSASLYPPLYQHLFQVTSVKVQPSHAVKTHKSSLGST